MQLGDKIRILHMDGEPQYKGKEGVITSIEKDFDGDIFLRGTWGGLSIYPHLDQIEYVSE